MPYSSTAFKEDVKQHFIESVSNNNKILDVGPGSGTYGKMLNQFYNIDGLEIHEP
jgi:tRNA1(Val) A37 N6-methylase TrmN6